MPSQIAFTLPSHLVNVAWADFVEMHQPIYTPDRVYKLLEALTIATFRLRLMAYLEQHQYCTLFELLHLFVVQDLHRQQLAAFAVGYLWNDTVVALQLRLQESIVYGILEALIVNGIEAFTSSLDGDIVPHRWGPTPKAQFLSVPMFRPPTVSKIAVFGGESTGESFDIEMVDVNDLMDLSSDSGYEGSDSDMSDSSTDFDSIQSLINASDSFNDFK